MLQSSADIGQEFLESLTELLLNLGEFIFVCIVRVAKIETERFVYKLYEQVQQLPPPHQLLVQLGTPGQVTWLPFPETSKTELSEQEFRFNDGQVLYYGRNNISKIVQLILQRQPSITTEIFGINGAGKSHILLALVCYHLKNQDRVIYFYQARQMLELKMWKPKLNYLLYQEIQTHAADPNFEYIKAIKYLLKYPNDVCVYGFLKALGLLLGPYVLLFVDQWDSLESNGDDLMLLEGFIEYFSRRPCLVSPANNLTAARRLNNSFKREYFDIFFGFDQVEFKAWKLLNNHKLPYMNISQSLLLQNLSDLLPRYLDEYVHRSESTFFARLKAMETTILQKSKYSWKSLTNGTRDSMPILQFGMMACLGDGIHTGLLNKQFRFFQQYLHPPCSSGVSCDFLQGYVHSIMEIQQPSLKLLCQWILEETNYYIIAYLFEQVGFSQLCQNGLSSAFPPLPPPSIFQPLSKSYRELRPVTHQSLVVCYKGRFKGVNCVVLTKDKLFGIQFNLTSSKTLIDQFLRSLSASGFPLTNIELFFVNYSLPSSSSSLRFESAQDKPIPKFLVLTEYIDKQVDIILETRPEILTELENLPDRIEVPLKKRLYTLNDYGKSEDDDDSDSDYEEVHIKRRRV